MLKDKSQITKISLFTLLKNKEYYTKKGYEVEKLKENYSDYYNTLIEVKVDDLIYSSSKEKIEVICEDCGSIYLSSLSSYIDRKKSKRKDLCRKCVRKITEKTNIEKYGTKAPIQNKKILDKVKKTNLEKYGCECTLQNKEIKMKAEKTNLEKYGTKHPISSEKVKNKLKETSIKKYGMYYLQTEEFKRKSKEFYRKKGYENSSQIPEVKEKYRKTSIEKYGVPHFMKNKDKLKEHQEIVFKKYKVPNTLLLPDNNEKRKKVMLEKYNVISPFSLEKFRLKAFETNIEKYGVKYPSQNKSIQEKIKKTTKERYNVDYVSQYSLFKEKAKQTCMKKYGFSHPMQVPEIRKKKFSKTSMSIPEKKLFEFLTNRGFEFIYQYDINGKNFDFAIFENNELQILIEIDGEYFHGLLNDSNDFHVHGQTDFERFSKVPEGVKFIVCDSLKIQKCFEEILYCMEIDYNEWIQVIFNSCKNSEFPYPEYDDKRMINDYNALSYTKYKAKSLVGQSIIRNFHKSIYSANIKNKPSPIEAWKTDELLLKSIENRFIYASKLSTHSIADGFNKNKIAPKVSVFRAILARELISKYLSNSNTIFDPFSGFSGRMLGATILGKTYIGQDLNEVHVEESNSIINFLQLKNCSVSKKDIFDSSGVYESLFTCPPYGEKENWNNENQKILKSDDWIEVCLEKFNCKEYLFVVDSTEKFKNNIVEIIDNNSHLGNNKELVIFIKKDNII